MDKLSQPDAETLMLVILAGIQDGYNEGEDEFNCSPDARCGSCVGCEAESAIRLLAARLAETEAQRDEYATKLHAAEWIMGAVHHEGEDEGGGLIQRAEAAERRVATLEAALRDVTQAYPHPQPLSGCPEAS